MPSNEAMTSARPAKVPTLTRGAARVSRFGLCQAFAGAVDAKRELAEVVLLDRAVRARGIFQPVHAPELDVKVTPIR